MAQVARSPSRASQKSRKPGSASVHIGLNTVDAGHYGGWSGELVACEFDARDMASIARAAGIRPTVLLTRKATREGALAAFRAAAKKLRAGDFFFLTYSGHGGQVPDVTGDEKDKKDETWCLYDGELIDDEIYWELSRFAKGVRILVLSDSCHSGTVTREPAAGRREAQAGRSRMMPPDIAQRTYREHRAFYDRLQRNVARASGKDGIMPDPDEMLAHVVVSPRLTAIAKKFKAAAILISGCQDNQTSLDGDHNGAFTEQLLRVWNRGAFRGNYVKLHARIKARMPASQTPNLFTLGSAATFAAQRPFQV